MDLSSTIAAIATPTGKGGVGILRISGAEALFILRRLVPDWPEKIDSHRLRLSKIYDLEGGLIDESLAVFMGQPKTYTGEDIVEFQCHGGPIILRRLLDAALSSGARIAEPGEFTRRAFLNGRLDLTQAEAVADLVNATSESAHKLALEHLQGALGETIESLMETLVEAAVLVEAAIDFSTEEHVYQIEKEEIRRRLTDVEKELTSLRARFDQGRRQREGVKVVILGPTNAGKSTLFNVLHGTERAIVTHIAGTTRDFLEEELQLGGAAIRLIDTAGLRETSDHVESIGIERSRSLAKQADLVLFMVDQSAPLPEAVSQEIASLHRTGTPLLLVLNKIDQPSGLTIEDRAALGEFDTIYETALGASTPSGVDELLEALGKAAEELIAGEGVLLSRARHLQGVLHALQALERAQEGLDMDMEHELIAIDLREALDGLGSITGKVSTDDLLARIFSDFCVGK